MSEEEVLDEDTLYPVFAYNETKTVVTLDVVSKKPLQFEEYKAFLFDFIKELDNTGHDLFSDDEYEQSDH